MSFLTNAKELTGAREKIAALESQVASLAAQVQTLSAQDEELEAEASAILAARDGAVAKVSELEAALIAEKTAHAETKASVENLAAVKAQQTLASIGQPPVAAPPASSAPIVGASVSEIRAHFATLAPGAIRSAFFVKHKQHLI